MSKKKKPATLNKAQLESEKARMLTRFLSRIEQLCTAYAGPEYFRKLHPELLMEMYISRYPALKAKLLPGTVLAKEKVVQYHKLLTKLIEDIPIDFDNGETIPLSWYLSDGLTLIYSIYAMSDTYPNAALLKDAFRDYFYDTDSDKMVTHMLGVSVHDANVLLSDYNHVIFHADHTKTALYDGNSTTNDVLIHIFTPERMSMVIENEKRMLTRVGWPEWISNTKMDWHWARVKPSALGFKTGALEMPVDVYIQQHALLKLKERIDITPGIMHYMVFTTFMNKDIRHVTCDNHNLIECRLAGQKVGYLVVTLHGNKLLIRTFLFLTNDGTPEGKKLEKLYKLGKLDKEYLGIDKLTTFISYYMENNPRLKKIFTDAGCGSLFKLGHLQEFSKNEIKARDPESIERFLADYINMKQNEAQDAEQTEEEEA